MSHAEKLAALAAVRELEHQQLMEAEQGQGSWTPLRACIASAGQACQQQARSQSWHTSCQNSNLVQIMCSCCQMTRSFRDTREPAHQAALKGAGHNPDAGALMQAEASVEVLGDLELFYARPSVSAPGLFQALSGTVSSVRASSWQPAQQLDCLLELEGALQVSRAQKLEHELSGW